MLLDSIEMVPGDISFLTQIEQIVILQQIPITYFILKVMQKLRENGHQHSNSFAIVFTNHAVLEDLDIGCLIKS